MPRKSFNKRKNMKSKRSKRSRKGRRNKRRSYKMRGGYGNCVYQVLKNNSEFCSEYKLDATDTMEKFFDNIREIQKNEIEGIKIYEDTINHKIFNLTRYKCPGGPNS